MNPAKAWDSFNEEAPDPLENTYEVFRNITGGYTMVTHDFLDPTSATLAFTPKEFDEFISYLQAVRNKVKAP